MRQLDFNVKVMSIHPCDIHPHNSAHNLFGCNLNTGFWTDFVVFLCFIDGGMTAFAVVINAEKQSFGASSSQQGIRTR